MGAAEGGLGASSALLSLSLAAHGGAARPAALLAALHASRDPPSPHATSPPVQSCFATTCSALSLASPSCRCCGEGRSWAGSWMFRDAGLQSEARCAWLNVPSLAPPFLALQLHEVGSFLVLRRLEPAHDHLHLVPAAGQVHGFCEWHAGGHCAWSAHVPQPPLVDSCCCSHPPSFLPFAPACLCRRDQGRAA